MHTPDNNYCANTTINVIGTLYCASILIDQYILNKQSIIAILTTGRVSTCDNAFITLITEI